MTGEIVGVSVAEQVVTSEFAASNVRSLAPRINAGPLLLLSRTRLLRSELEVWIYQFQKTHTPSEIILQRYTQ